MKAAEFTHTPSTHACTHTHTYACIHTCTHTSKAKPSAAMLASVEPALLKSNILLIVMYYFSLKVTSNMLYYTLHNV